MNEIQRIHDTISSPDQELVEKIQELSGSNQETIKDTLKNLWGEKEPIIGFNFCGESYEVPNWQRLLVVLCEILYERHPEEFKKVHALQAFSHSPNNLYDPRIIFPASVFVEGAYSDRKIKELSRELLELFGYQIEDLKIF